MHASKNPQRIVARLGAPLKSTRRAGLKTYWMYLGNSCRTTPRHVPFPMRRTRPSMRNTTTDDVTSTQLMESLAGKAVPAFSNERFLPRELLKDGQGRSRSFGPDIEFINSQILGVSGKLLRVSPLQYPEDWFWEDPAGKRLRFVSECRHWPS
jgi:hypothetical protein